MKNFQLIEKTYLKREREREKEKRWLIITVYIVFIDYFEAKKGYKEERNKSYNNDILTLIGFRVESWVECAKYFLIYMSF